MAQPDLEAAQSLRKKQQHFNGLARALKVDDDDDVPDEGRLASMRMMQQAAGQRQKSSSKASNNSALARSASDTNLASKDKHHTERVPHLDQGPPSSTADNNARPRATLIKGQTFSGTSNKAASAVHPRATPVPIAAGKRKRGSIIPQVPEDQQIFKELRFYFFPNNDTNPARKMRITKAREFGAEWVKDFDESVTHVIVDKAMDFTQVLKFLKRDSLPSQMTVVSESYPAECISYRAILDHGQKQFKVKGRDLPPSKPDASGSDVSLKLKPAGKAVKARQPETQTSDDRRSSPPRKISNGGLAVGSSHAQNQTVPSTAFASSDEFEAALEQARVLQYVSLEDEDDSRPSSSSGILPAFEQQQELEAAGDKSKKKGKLQMQDKFQCMQANDGTNSSTNPNAATITILDQMSHYYDRIGDNWRTRAYRKAIGTLRKHPTKVRTKDEALALPQIGERLATKIEEIAFTNRLRRLDNTKADPNDQILQTFMGVYGVGFAAASKFVGAGYSTLDELSSKAQLTANQRIGIAHYEDFNSRIPRAEVEQLGAIVRKTLLALDPNFEVIVGGSYRRGAQTSGDIDCILTHTKPTTSGEHIRTVVLDRLVPQLFEHDFLVAELAATSRDDGSKWHGACHLPSQTPPSPWRRIDLLLVPPAELGAALIYFSGNDIFNRSMRLLASTKGMRLNQRGLYEDVMRGKDRAKLTEGKLVEGRDEKRIFEVLGVPWRPAELRNC